MTRLFKAFLFVFIFSCATFLLGGFGVRRVYADGYNPQCVAAGIADYMKRVIDNIGPLPGNVRLLTPTFNMSEPQFEELYDAFRANPDTQAVEGRLAGTIGNAYNTSGQTVGYWVSRINGPGIRAAYKGPIGEMHLAETGRVPPDPIPSSLISSVARESGITLTSANLFNAFNTNPGWSQFELTDPEIQSICNGDCSHTGVNLAGGFNSGSYGKATGLGMRYVVGIASGAGAADVAAVVEAANAGLIPIVRIGSGDCNSSGAGEFESAEAYATFIKEVAGAIGGKTVYFIVGPNEPDAERWWSRDYGQKTDCGPCTGGQGTAPPTTCSGGMYKLTINGTVKTSRLYTFNGRNPITGQAIYSPYVYGMQTNDPVVKGLPVFKAVVQVHDSVIEHSADTGNSGAATHPNNSGLLNGMLVGGYKAVKTDANGRFTITAESKCSDVYRSNWKGTGYEQFLSFSCPDKPSGRAAGLYAKDNFGMILNLPEGAEGGTINNLEVNVDCSYNPEFEHGRFPVNKDLKINNVNRDVYMSCSGVRKPDGSTYSMAGMGPNYNYEWNQGVQFKDWYDVSYDLGHCDVGPGDNCGPCEKNMSTSRWEGWVKDDILGDVGCNDEFSCNKVIPFGRDSGAQTETRMEIADQRFSLDQIASIIGFYTGVRDGGVKPAQYYRLSSDVPSGVETYNDHEGKPQMSSCEGIRRCNTGVTFDEGYQNDNAQTCGGTAFNLASPYAGVVKELDGSGDVDLYRSEFVGRFRDLYKDVPICTDAGGNVTIKQIMPPVGYCGDINGKNGLEPNLEQPCPEVQKCGDYNGDGVRAEEGERDCSTVRVLTDIAHMTYSDPGYYKYDSRYFPYFAMFSPTIIPTADSETRRSYSLDDSYASMCPRGLYPNEGYDPTQGADGSSKPMNATCPYGPGAFEFYTHEEVKFPGFMDYGVNYHEALNLSDPSYKTYPLPFQSIGTPQFNNSTDSTELVKDSVSGMAKTLTPTKGANLFRIGMPQDLCSCSLVEQSGSGNLGLGNCASVGYGVDGAPDPVEPSNLMTVGRDQGPNAGSAASNEIYNPIITGTHAIGSDRASQVAGGADWVWQTTKSTEYPIDWTHGLIDPSKLVASSDDDGTHYGQEILTQRPPAILTGTIDIGGVNGDGTVDDKPVCHASKHCDVDKTTNADGTTSLSCSCTMSVHCDSIVQHPTTNYNMSAWMLPRFKSTPLVFQESLFPPKIQMTHELGSFVSLEDSYMTKAQRVLEATDRTDMPGNQASGYAIPRGTDYASWTSLLSNLVSAPTPAPILLGSSGSGPGSGIEEPTPIQTQILIDRSGGSHRESVGTVDPPTDGTADPSHTPGAPTIPPGFGVPPNPDGSPNPHAEGFVAMSYGAYTDYKGMSQYGAKGRAEAGKNYTEILKFYYNVGVRTVSGAGVDGLTINVANEGPMTVKDYLYGIAEMPSNWPTEALRAQAIAARTYAYEFAVNGRVVCTTQYCPVYVKTHAEDPVWRTAVDDTKDKVLNNAVTAYYSSTMGGFVENIGWDSTGGPTHADDTARDKAYEKKAGAPWFYKGWYTKSYNDPSFCDNRDHPYLTKAEMADMLNAWVVWSKGTLQDRERILPININNKICWDIGGNPYTWEEMKALAGTLLSVGLVIPVPGYSTVNSVDSVLVDDNYGRTTWLTFITDRGPVTVDADTFSTVFNIRAPGYLSIKSRLYEVVKKTL